MKHDPARLMLAGLTCCVLAAGAGMSQTLDAGSTSHVQITDGSVSFEVATNAFGTMVRGRSDALSGGALVITAAASLRLERLEATLPVDSLKTGIRLRDRHMLNHVFQTSDGQLPDIRFAANGAECTATNTAETFKCVASGPLTIRGTSRPFELALEIKRERDRYRAKGTGTIALSAYGIDRPSRFGVRTEDDVTIHVEFSAKRVSATTARLP